MFRPDSVRILSVLAIATFSFSHVQAQIPTQTTLFVDVDDPKSSDAGGISGKLPGPPFKTIGRAIALSLRDDEIVVRPGTYRERINFFGKAITVRSSGGSGVTIIDVTGLGGPVVRFDSGEGPATVLDGFTLTGAKRQDPGALRGGGMFIVDSSPTVRNCRFLSNEATNGGGVSISDGSPTFVGCDFDGNEAIRGGGGMEVTNGSRVSLTDCEFTGNDVINGSGGGILSDGSRLLLTRCTFSGNTASENGGGIYSDLSDQLVTGCMFDNNRSGLKGGGIYNTSSRSIVANTRFIGNLTTNGAGGGIYNFESSPTVVNCIFSGNRANGIGAQGGGIFSTANSNPTVTNCTFAGNFAAFRGGGITNFSGVTILRNCILWGNSTAPSSSWNTPNIYNGSTTIVKCSNIEGSGGSPFWQGPTFGTDDGGNIDADPRFASADLRLLGHSPSIDAGCGLGTLLDLDGHDRIVDHASAFDTGLGFHEVIDMGAYEFGSHAPPPPTPNPDLDLDGDVDLADFVLFLAGFTGPPPPPPICGNGVIESGEQCDDGNTQPDDGCDETCQREIPANDNCVDNITVPDGDTPFNNIWATLDGPTVDPICDESGANTIQIPADVWFHYVATCTGTVEVSLCGSNYDTKLAVYDGATCPSTAQSETYCNDDGCDPLFLDSKLTFSAVAGDRFMIRVGGFTPQSQGTGTLTLNCIPTPLPCAGTIGDCHAANGSPGCIDHTCCELVCSIDEFCCDRTWDDACADRAAAICGLNCGSTGGLARNNACDTVVDPLIDYPLGGCSDEQTCRDVCTDVSDCCRRSWDLECVCRAAPAEPCCQAICLADNRCCTGWHPDCDTEAGNLPAVCPP